MKRSTGVLFLSCIITSLGGCAAMNDVLAVTVAIADAYYASEEAPASQPRQNQPVPQQVQRQPQSTSISNSTSTRKPTNEASHCVKVIRAEDKNRCGRPGGMEFVVSNTCPETVKYSIPIWELNGKLRMLGVGTAPPGGSDMMWSCDLQPKYGLHLSACFDRNWPYKCHVLTTNDYDESGRLIY